MTLTEGPIWRRLFELWWPMIFGIIAVKAIDLSDAYFVGQLGDTELAAISYTFPIVLTLISLSIGLSAGASSVLSRAIGSKSTAEKVRSVSVAAILLSLMAAFSLSLLGYLSVDVILKAVGATGRTFDLASSFMKIWLLATPFLILPIVAGGLLRAAGDGTTPALIMGLIAVLNIALNPLLIYGLGPVPAFGMDGAAIATLIARAVATGVALWLLTRRDMLALSWIEAKDSVAHWGNITMVGGPASLSTAINPISISIATAAVSRLGDNSVAAFGVATKIEEFAVVPMLALSSAIAPLVGQNSGADMASRSRLALQCCALVAMIWAVMAALAFWAFGPALVGFFSDDAAIQQAAATYLMIVPLSFVGYGCVISVSAALNALGRSLSALSLTGLRSFGLLAPASWIAVLMGYEFTGVAFGVATANLLSGIAACVIIWRHPLSVVEEQRAQPENESQTGEGAVS